ncbi:MAG: divergent polysaccharide deacetylase family protein [Halieaceae bacterium]
MTLKPLTREAVSNWIGALLLLSCLWPSSLTAQPQRTLVIIIDDVGYKFEAGRQAIALPGKLNIAILPHTRNSEKLARMTLAAGKEVLLHAPMSNVLNKPLGPGGLTNAMTRQELRRTLAASIESTPGVRGVSNHMGSLLTAQREPMEWVMQELSARGLYYIDSRTTMNSLGAQVAGEYGIPNLTRHVFLDNDTHPTAIHWQFKEALEMADRHGMAIAIGHPYRSTLKYLARQLPRLEKNGYQLALVSEVLEQQLQYSAGQLPRVVSSAASP